MWVSPFGHPRISGYVLLPAAFRSLSRPSSAPSAKAFALCSSSVDLCAVLLPYLPGALPFGELGTTFRDFRNIAGSPMY